MQLTQQQINDSVDWAIATFSGKQVPDEYGGYPGQCVSLIRREFIHRSGQAAAPNSPNDEGDGYLQLPGAFKDYFTVQTFDRTKSYPKGSYAINVSTHHIMIYLNQAGQDASVFEQNADPDGSPAAVKTRAGNKISHILIPILANSQGVNMETTPQASDRDALYAACIFGEFVLGRIGLVHSFLTDQLPAGDDIHGHVGYWKNSPSACADIIAGYESAEASNYHNDIFVARLSRNSVNVEAKKLGLPNVGSQTDIDKVLAAMNNNGAATPKQLAAEKAMDAVNDFLKIQEA